MEILFQPAQWVVWSKASIWPHGVRDILNQTLKISSSLQSPRPGTTITSPNLAQWYANDLTHNLHVLNSYLHRPRATASAANTSPASSLKDEVSMLASLLIPQARLPMNGKVSQDQSVLLSATSIIPIPLRTELISKRSSRMGTRPTRLIYMRTRSMDLRWERIWRIRRRLLHRKVRISRLWGGLMHGSRMMNEKLVNKYVAYRLLWGRLQQSGW